MGLEGAIALYALLALFVLAWFVLVVANAWRLVEVVGLEGEDRADNRGWIVWSCSVASLFTGFCVAAITWVAAEWVLPQPDPFEASLGTLRLTGIARTNLIFVLVSNAVVGAVAAIVYALSGAAGP